MLHVVKLVAERRQVPASTRPDIEEQDVDGFVEAFDSVDVWERGAFLQSDRVDERGSRIRPFQVSAVRRRLIHVGALDVQREAANRNYHTIVRISRDGLYGPLVLRIQQQRSCP